jgi:hypothetical protein
MANIKSWYYLGFFHTYQKSEESTSKIHRETSTQKCQEGAFAVRRRKKQVLQYPAKEKGT